MESITPENASPGMVATLTALANLQGHNDPDKIVQMMAENPELEAAVRQQAFEMDRQMADDTGMAELRQAQAQAFAANLMREPASTTASRRGERLQRENHRTVRWSVNLLTYVIRKALFEPNWRDPRYATYVGLTSVG